VVYRPLDCFQSFSIWHGEGEPSSTWYREASPDASVLHRRTREVSDFRLTHLACFSTAGEARRAEPALSISSLVYEVLYPGLELARLFIGRSRARLADRQGVLVAMLTYVTFLAGFANLELPVQLAEDVINAIVLMVQTFLMFVSAVVACFGLARKIFTTFFNINKVIE
jgi:hypothetical protein